MVPPPGLIGQFQQRTNGSLLTHHLLKFIKGLWSPLILLLLLTNFVQFCQDSATPYSDGLAVYGLRLSLYLCNNFPLKIKPDPRNDIIFTSPRSQVNHKHDSIDPPLEARWRL